MTGTIADKLQGILDTKSAIRQAIIYKGVAVQDTTPFAEYANLIRQIESGLPTQIIMNAKLLGTPVATSLKNISANGSGISATKSGNPALDNTVNIICVCAGEIIYEGNAGPPKEGEYIPFLKITYSPIDGSNIRIGYLSVCLKHDGISGTYTVIDKQTNLPIILDSSKTYAISLAHCMIFRSSPTSVISGSSFINNNMLGLNTVTATIDDTMQNGSSSSNIEEGSEIYEDISIPKSIQEKVESGGYDYVSISAFSFTGSATSITGFNKGDVVTVADNIIFK